MGFVSRETFWPVVLEGTPRGQTCMCRLVYGRFLFVWREHQPPPFSSSRHSRSSSVRPDSLGRSVQVQGEFLRREPFTPDHLNGPRGTRGVRLFSEKETDLVVYYPLQPPLWPLHIGLWPGKTRTVFHLYIRHLSIRTRKLLTLQTLVEDPRTIKLVLSCQIWTN